MKHLYSKICAHRLQGERIKKELVALLVDLPEYYDQVTRNAAKLKDVQMLYMDFLTFVHGERYVHAAASVQL